jgi:fibronectin type 3 domain-containing protein
MAAAPLVLGKVYLSTHRFSTGIAVVGACVLLGVWFSATNGTTPAAAAGQHKLSVTLTWKASTSTVAGYNVYRSTVKGRDYVKINVALVTGQTSYKDETVQSGTTYYYVTRAVDAKGKESADSNVTTVVVP